MTTPNVFVKVGTTLAKVNPARYALVKHQLEQASKIPSVKAARAAVLRRRDKRHYPKFKDGMSTADYVRQFTMINARTTGGGLRTGPFLSMQDIAREEAWITGFYEPLSTNPQFTQVDLTIEESI